MTMKAYDRIVPPTPGGWAYPLDMRERLVP